jgi:hypothetical protein
MDVIATGMVSSLGYDAQTACAARRAGLTRPAELPFTVLENDLSAGLAIGHPAPLFGGGFSGDARLIRLLEGALDDLVAQVPADLLAASKVGFYLGLPASDRERQGLDLMADEGRRANYLERLGEARASDEVMRAGKILAAAARMAHLPPKVASAVHDLRVSITGHTAVIELFEEARKDLESGRIELAIVGGVDSLVGHTTLAWLQLTHRLKSAESPAGLSPGEAAALVALGHPSFTRRMTIPPRVRIGRTARAASSTAFLSGTPSDGLGQSQVVRALADTTRPADWLIVDQNGEVFRAHDWGCTLVRLQGTGTIDGAAAHVWYPAGSFGDIGAASGAVATCMAVAAHERGYAPSPRAVILTNSDGPARAGCVVTALES